MSLQARAQVAQQDYQSLQAELETAVESRQRLGAQLAENESVQKEFALLTPNNTVYKLISNVLVQQDQAEAKGNVEKRLEFIRGETTRVEARLKELEAKMEAKKMELVKMQTEANAGQQPDAASPQVAAA